MATIIERYYSDELVEWNRMIRFYRRETNEFEHKLAEVIQRNSTEYCRKSGGTPG